MTAVAAPRWLVLWDIDGTLLVGASGTHARTVWRTLEEVHGVAAHGLPGGQSAAGMTDSQICRQILVGHGTAADVIDRHAAEVVARVSATYDPEDLTDRVVPGLEDVLAALDARPDVVQSLVTGNFEAVARRKLAAAGIGDWFDPRWGGGFGSDHEERDRLPALARSRAGTARDGAGAPPWDPRRTVIVGDTPRDIACARADGTHVIAVTTGPHDRAALAGADVVVEDATGLLHALVSLFQEDSA